MKIERVYRPYLTAWECPVAVHHSRLLLILSQELIYVPAPQDFEFFRRAERWPVRLNGF
jgi:hypothetical protein